MTPARAGWLVVRFAVGVALLVWLSRSGVIAWSRVAALLAHPLPIALAFALITGAFAATAWRLCVLAAPLGLPIGFGASMRLLLIGICFSVFMPGSAGGDIARIYWALRDQPGRRPELAAILLFDRVIGLVALLLFPLLAALAFPRVVDLHPAIGTILWWAAGLAGLAMAALFLLWGRRSGGWIERRISSLPLGGIVSRATAVVRGYRAFPGAVGAALMLSLVASGLCMVTMLVLARVVGGVGSAPVMLTVLPIGFLVNAIPITPGGLGVGEVAMDRLFTLAGLTGGAAALISWRLLQLVPAAIGLLLYIQGRADLVAPVTRPGGPETAS